MKTTYAVTKHRILRIVFILTGSFFLSCVSLILFYSLFLLLPSLFINAGIIGVAPLLLLFICSLLVPVAMLSYYFPFAGDRFFNSIITPPCSSKDIKSALELESNRSYPKAAIEDRSKITSYLSERYSNKIFNCIIPGEKILKKIFPNIKRIIALCIIIIISIILTIVKIDLVKDVITALQTGLPAELIALDPPISFEKLEAVIIPPAYIESGLPKVTNLIKTNKIMVMQGSTVILKGKLKNITTGKLILSSDKGVEYFPISIMKNGMFDVSFLAPMKGAFAMEFAFIKEINDRTTGKSRVFSIKAIPDMPPVITIHSPPMEHNIVFGNSFGISFSASDDYGILEITLYHRDPEYGEEYHKELIARFPKEPKINYDSTYMWNPVLREGKKISELLYHPGTKMLEYFIEVKDINIFSSSGVARSDIRHLYFTDIFTELNDALNIIRSLIKDGKMLMQSPVDKDEIDKYDKKLNKAVKAFSNDLREIMPGSTIIQKTNKMINTLKIYNPPKIKEELQKYISFLERYLVFLNLLIQAESSEILSHENAKMNETMSEQNLKRSMNKIDPIAKLLHDNFKNELEEIQKLIEKGDLLAAKAKMQELIKKLQKQISEKIFKSSSKANKISDEINKKLDLMKKKSEELIKDQKTNLKLTDMKKFKKAQGKQKEINTGLKELNDITRNLSSEYPFVLSSLNSYARTARLYGERAMQTLEPSKLYQSSIYQKQVISYLNALLESLSKQKELLQQLKKGNFESLMPKNFSNRYVFIPKEAVYTIPIDYKNKIIEMSRERSKNTKVKEAFWRDILE
ncbi:MAG: DUF4175 family protein [Spirochaetota bacterium]|nr:DUF4175 family protein [Spirochaetota bacterium]